MIKETSKMKTAKKLVVLMVVLAMVFPGFLMAPL